MKSGVFSLLLQTRDSRLKTQDFLATHTGFEPVISAVTGQRPFQAGPMGQLSQRRYRDSNSLSACFADTPRTKRISAVNRVVLDGLEPSDLLCVGQRPSPLDDRTIE